MGSLDYALTRSFLKRGIVRQNADDEAIAIRLRYVGSGSVTSVTVDQDSDVELVTSDGGTDTYTITDGNYDTVGELVDAINKDNIFEAVPVDALRSDAIDGNELIDGAVTSSTDIDGTEVWDLLVDTSVEQALTVTVSPAWPDGDPGWDKPEGHRVHIKEISYYANVNGASANAVRVYRRRGSEEVQVYGDPSVDATATTTNWASGEGKITGQADDEFIVRVQDSTSLTDDTSNYIRVVAEYE